MRVDPKSSGTIKQNPSALGITNVGRGHKCRVAREMKVLPSRNMTREVLTWGNLVGLVKKSCAELLSRRALGHSCATVSNQETGRGGALEVVNLTDELPQSDEDAVNLIGGPLQRVSYSLGLFVVFIVQILEPF